jgi:hypothetical protein
VDPVPDPLLLRKSGSAPGTLTTRPEAVNFYLTSPSKGLGPHTKGYWGIKRNGLEADHLAQSRGEVKNGGAPSLLPRTSSWHGAELSLGVALTCA